MQSNLRIYLGTALVLLFCAANSLAGSLQIALPQLLGEYSFSPNPAVGAPFKAAKSVVIPTQYGFYSISEAIVVVEGTASAGKARGDGILREPTEFELIPYVKAGLNSYTHVESFITPALTGAFRVERSFPGPYIPETTPLPNPNGYPPIEIQVGASVGLNGFYTNFPALIGVPPADGVDADEGLVVDRPITATITSAYLILHGPGVVPEPSATILLIAGAMLAFVNVRRSRSAVHFFAHS